jgi:uncharacterized protein YdhG (YjbR/CyaY superfamily)
MRVDDYIANAGEPGTSVLEAIRAVVRNAVPNVTEAIKYDMPVFHLGEAYIFYMGGWKTHAAIYPIAKHYGFETDITPYRSGKDTVKFPYNKPLPLDLIARIVEARVADIQNK